jgi:hypothetical protein
MKGAYDTTATGEARIRLPEGVSLVSGDTLYRGHPGGRDARWRIVVRADRGGAFELHGSLRIVSRDGVVDEAEFLMPFDVRSDSVITGQSRLIRTETIRGGKRYRYGSKYLVPIDRSEAVWQGDIERLGQKPRAPHDVEAVCASCSGEFPQNLTLVAMVAADGRVVEVRRRGPVEDGDDEAFEAAKEAPTRTRFTPARLQGTAVADWAVVRVSILPPK